MTAGSWDLVLDSLWQVLVVVGSGGSLGSGFDRYLNYLRYLRLAEVLRGISLEELHEKRIRIVRRILSQAPGIDEVGEIGT